MLKKYGGSLVDKKESYVPIYRVSLLKTGGAATHGLRQMLMDMDQNGDNGLAQNLGLTEEDVKKVLCMKDEDLCKVMSFCLRLYHPVSEAAFPLFSEIKEKLETLILDIGDENLKDRCEKKDFSQDEKSSSPILLWAPSDPEFKKLLTDKQKKALEKWTYPGWCPMDSCDRLKKLVRFPIDEFDVPDKISVPLMSLEEAARTISCPRPPKIEQKTEDIDAQEKECQTLVRRALGLKEDLEKWEDYFGQSAKMLSKLHLSMLLNDGDS